MQQVRRRVGQPVSGAQAVAAAVVAVVGVVAATNPQNVLLKAITEAVSHIANAVPTVITACGAVVAAFSQPPRLRR